MRVIFNYYQCYSVLRTMGTVLDTSPNTPVMQLLHPTWAPAGFGPSWQTPPRSDWWEIQIGACSGGSGGRCFGLIRFGQCVAQLLPAESRLDFFLTFAAYLAHRSGTARENSLLPLPLPLSPSLFRVLLPARPLHLQLSNTVYLYTRHHDPSRPNPGR